MSFFVSDKLKNIVTEEDLYDYNSDVYIVLYDINFNLKGDKNEKTI